LPGEGKPLKELRIRETADAVAQKDATILLHHAPSCRALRSPDAVFDDLEDDVERRQREDGHHQPFHSRRVLEASAGNR